jgi:hypothetical protein
MPREPSASELSCLPQTIAMFAIVLKKGGTKLDRALLGSWADNRHPSRVWLFAPMRSLGVVWTKENLDRYLTSPTDMVPGTIMMFPGLRKNDERESLIECLASPDCSISSK